MEFSLLKITSNNSQIHNYLYIDQKFQVFIIQANNDIHFSKIQSRAYSVNFCILLLVKQTTYVISNHVLSKSFCIIIYHVFVVRSDIKEYSSSRS